MHKAIRLLKKIPDGRVTTYAELARVCETSPRAVGAIMRSNSEPGEYPCYKVVKSDGSIGGYGGSSRVKIKEKIEKLKSEGVVIESGKINLGRFGHKFSG